MPDWKKEVAGYFSFTRKDRIGLLVISILILLVLFLPSVFPSGFNQPATADTSWVAMVRKLEYKQKPGPDSSPDQHSMAYQYDRPEKTTTNQRGLLFQFDPNTISAEEWKKLGVPAKTITTIQRYREKGGQFRKPEDLQRVYGLPPLLYQRLLPYVKIEGKKDDRKPAYAKEIRPSFSKPSYGVIDINLADTAAFIDLPGIGSKLAVRIVLFREKLGGFHSMTQLGEVYGLQDSIFQKIKPYLKLENTVLKKININTATIDELKAHPYIRYVIANPLIAYRNQHGDFAQVGDVRKIAAVTEEMFAKMEPYLTVK